MKDYIKKIRLFISIYNLNSHFFYPGAALELDDKYKKTVDEIEALKDHLGNIHVIANEM